MISQTVDAIFLELENMIIPCNIPRKDDLLNSSLELRLDWDPVVNFKKSEMQSEESYIEQKFAIHSCKNAIDAYSNTINQLTMTKSIVIRGHPGAGKSFCMMYMMIYAISQGYFITPIAKMSHRGLQIGGTNWDKLLGLRGNEDKTNILRRAELAITRLKKNKKNKISF